MTWWRKRTSEREAVHRAVVGIAIRTQLEAALHDMQRAFDRMQETIAQLPEETPRAE